MNKLKINSYQLVNQEFIKNLGYLAQNYWDKVRRDHDDQYEVSDQQLTGNDLGIAAFPYIVEAAHQFNDAFSKEVLGFIVKYNTAENLEEAEKIYATKWLKELKLSLSMYQFRMLKEYGVDDAAIVRMTVDCYMLGLYQDLVSDSKDYIFDKYPDLIMAINL